MSVLKTAWANLQDGLGNRFSWSHVKAIFYNYAEQKLLSTKLDEMDALIDEKIAKAMMSNVQVNDETKVPTSALAYSMSQDISQNAQDITQLYSEMITITTKDYEVTLTSSGGSNWGYSYGFSLVENGDLPTRTQLVIPIACGLKTNWNTTGMVSVHQNDFVRVASNTGGIFDLRLAFISRRAPD